MTFADLALAQRLEGAEGFAGEQFAAARARLQPGSRAESARIAGGYVVFDAPDSPVTQSFALGLFEPLTRAILDQVEHFFFDRGSPTDLEICPFAGVEALDLLCAREYRPIEISNVMYRMVEPLTPSPAPGVRVRVVGPDEADLWADVSARGWAHDHPEYLGFLRATGAVLATRSNALSFLADLDGTPGAAGALCLHEGVALFGGAATVPELRRRGLQSALHHARMNYASEHDCDVASVVVQPGSDSQRNAERNGFRIAYSRIKWRLRLPAAA